MKKRALMGTREANTMMALVCSITVYLIGPQAHAVDLTIDSGTTAINSDTTYGETRIAGIIGQSATLEVTSGTVTTDTTFIGYNGTGTLNLTGGNLTTGQFFVGYNGAGTLNLIGGNLTTGQSIIGTNIDSTATVSAGTWTLNSSLQIGFNAAIGTLTIDAGGTVIAEDLGRNPGSTINLNAGGTLQINGSMFTNFLGGTGDLANNGTLIFNLGSGNISHSGVFSGSGSLIKQGTTRSASPGRIPTRVRRRSALARSN